jgi:hypothetical protein
MGALSNCMTQPHLVYHKHFIRENGEKVAKGIEQRLLTATDKSLREVRKDSIDGIMKAIENIQKRYTKKE